MKNLLLLAFNIFLALVIACQPVVQSVENAQLQPGDEINGMTITTGGGQAPPLWAFCSPAQKNEAGVIADCHVPLLSKLAIGLPFDGTNQALEALDWSGLTWRLSLDGYPVDLKAFGVYTYVVPDLAPGPSPVREVFRQKRAWDVVLVNPDSGMHTLRGMARTGTDTYTWVVNFIVAESPAH